MMMQMIIVRRGLSVCGRGRRGTGLLVTSSLAGWARTQSDPWFAVACPDDMGPAWCPVGPGGPHVGPMRLAIRVRLAQWASFCYCYVPRAFAHKLYNDHICICYQ